MQAQRERLLRQWPASLLQGLLHPPWLRSTFNGAAPARAAQSFRWCPTGKPETVVNLDSSNRGQSNTGTRRPRGGKQGASLSSAVMVRGWCGS